MKPIELAWHTWSVIPESFARAFLIEGTERALLIDTGAGDTDLKSLVLALTDKPVDVVNTHNHGDHMAANDAFGDVYMHPADLARLKEPGKIKPVKEGFVFNLGGREVAVIETPGHTPGSISLYDQRSGLLFTGDMVSKDPPIYFIEGDANAEDFAASLKKLRSLDKPMFGAHDPTVNGRETLDKLLETLALFVAGKIKPVPAEGPMPADLYISPNGTGFRCPKRP